MTNPVRDQIQQCSFGGVPFAFSRFQTTARQKTAEHEFPNTSRRYIEDLGKSPEQFNVTAIIYGGAQYSANVQRMRDILTRGGVMPLVHPTQGTFDVKCTNYTLTESESDLGIATFEIIFKRVDDAPPRPAAGVPSRQTIARSAATVSGNTSSAINSQWSPPVSAASIEDAASKLLGAADRIQTVVTGFGGVAADSISDVARAVRDLTEDVYSIIQTPGRVVASLDGLLGTFATAFDPSIFTGNANEASYAAHAELFTFGDDDVPTANDTRDLILREQNRDLVNNHIQAVALAQAYDDASGIDFATVDDVNAVQGALDAQVSKLTQQLDEQSAQAALVNTVSSASGRAGSLAAADALDASNATIQAITDLRSTARPFFNTARITASRVITADLPVRPAAVQAYAIYGSDERADQLIQLNGVLNTQYLGGPATKVVTA